MDLVPGKLLTVTLTNTSGKETGALDWIAVRSIEVQIKTSLR